MANSRSFPPVSVETLAAFAAHRAAIVRAVAAAALRRSAELTHPDGDAEGLLTDGLDFLTQALALAMHLNNPEILRPRLESANAQRRADGVPPDHLLSRLHLLDEAIAAALPPRQAAEIQPFVAWMIADQQARVARYGQPAGR